MAIITISYFIYSITLWVSEKMSAVQNFSLLDKVKKWTLKPWRVWQQLVHTKVDHVIEVDLQSR